MRPEDLLKLAENTSTVAFHKFVLLCKGREKDIFCFFEGRDSQYYSPRVKNITKRNYHPITCGNKKSVIDVYGLIAAHREYDKYSTAFFIDSDFDPSVGIERIFETPCYSVENFYVNRDTFSEILKNEFGLTEEDEEYKKAITIFESELSTFSKETMLFNAWYAALKSKKIKEGHKSTNVSLEDKIPKEFVCIKIGSISSNYTLDEINKRFPDAIQITEDEVMEEVKKIQESNVYDKLRGKFQFSFLYNFLRFVIDDANGRKSIIKKRTKFNVDKANMYAQLSQYAVTPKILVDYLKKFEVH